MRKAKKKKKKSVATEPSIRSQFLSKLCDDLSIVGLLKGLESRK